MGVFVFVFLFVFVFFELYEVVISRGADTAQKSLSRDNSLHTFTLSHFLWSTGKSTKAMTKYIICQCQRIFETNRFLEGKLGIDISHIRYHHMLRFQKFHHMLTFQKFHPRTG